MLLKEISILDDLKWYYKLVILFVWFVIGRYALNGMGTCDYRFIPIDYVAGVAGTMVFYYIAAKINRRMMFAGRGLAILGQYTISVLIIHQLVASFIWYIKLDLNGFWMIIITCL
jgi:hypothetical protein